jgi:phosphoadenosine phosphosulfate reductase
VWLSGVRAVQSDARATLPLVEWDDTHSVLKVYPLLDVSDDALQAYIAAHRVPTHPLYAKGYASIGCAPCTRPIKHGEHPRAGRWWWEHGNQECGLHVVNGKLERTHA